MTETPTYREACASYGRACRQHLRRAQLSRALALRQAASGAAVGPGDEELVREALGGAAGDVEAAVASTVTRTHFLLLKVEFELFLNRMAHCVWDHHFPAMLRQAKGKPLSQTYKLAEFAHAAARGDAKAFVLRKVVPAHGLGGLCGALEDGTGIDVAGLLRGRGEWRHWAQVRSAFEVRHLIEHANGRLDDDFLKKLEDDGPLRDAWQGSSWGGLPLRPKAKVPIRDEDFEATLGAMLVAAGRIADALGAFVPRPG
jgi:hypothetical protein